MTQFCLIFWYKDIFLEATNRDIHCSLRTRNLQSRTCFWASIQLFRCIWYFSRHRSGIGYIEMDILTFGYSGFESRLRLFPYVVLTWFILSKLRFIYCQRVSDFKSHVNLVQNLTLYLERCSRDKVEYQQFLLSWCLINYFKVTSDFKTKIQLVQFSKHHLECSLSKFCKN